MSTNIYPQSPSSVPENLTNATPTYKSRAWMAMGGLTLFIALYMGLTAWFAWTAWRMFSSFYQGADFDIAGAAAGVTAAFLFVFLAKALFAVRHSDESRDIEATKEDHPQLFDFLYKLADEAGAPRPHKVYLSPQVNAAVFYDLSLLNLIFPSRKNLLIGLGLVNVLNLGELKAVLAHEFGHFAQRSMAVGRWVYVSQQIAAHIIAERGVLDSFLTGLSRFDLRIAWVGWILRLIVWSIRSLLDTAFSLVVLSERALSRQMEFQADLVAVSLTGSDALVHALNKLHAGDDAWSRTLNFVNQEAGEKRRVPDIFAVQTRVIGKMRKIYNDESYGRVEKVPSEHPEKHRVFTSNLASPPQMWSTHPENSAREENAKTNYVSCPIDTRGAWDIFNDPDNLRKQMSDHLVATLDVKFEQTSLEESLTNLNKQYSKTWLLPCYRGAYLGRSVVRSVEKVEQLYLPDCGKPTTEDLDSLYPEELGRQLEKVRELYEERHMLQALKDKVMDAEGGAIQFRGETIKRRELPKAIAEVNKEIKELETIIASHDKKVRSLHVEAAKELGNGWPEYLQALTALLHYADHSEAEIEDVNGYVANVWAVITADGNISDSEAERLISAVSDAHAVMKYTYKHGQELELNPPMLKKFGDQSLQESIGKYDLPKPNRENINDWMKVFDGWVGIFQHSFTQLRLIALEELLLTEAKIAGALRQNKSLGEAPQKPVVPKRYKTLVPGGERELQSKLNLWDSFVTATGFFPALARFLVAVSIVGSVLWWGQSLGKMELTVYNGLAQTVKVDINGTKLTLVPLESRTISLAPANQLEFLTQSKLGEPIETFTQDLSSAGYQHGIYNVASASPLVKWWVVYGAGRDRDEQYLGAPRWSTAKANYFFKEPPEQIQTSGTGETRTVISGFGNKDPSRQLNMLETPEEMSALIRAHARWDNKNSKYFQLWLAYASALDDGLDIVRERIKTEPRLVPLLRMEQSLTEGSEHEEVCQRHAALSAQDPDNADFKYLAIRCMPDSPEQDSAFLQGFKTWPDHAWFSLAVAYHESLAGSWEASIEDYLNAVKAYRPLKAYLSEDLLRLHRVTDYTSDLDVNRLAKLNSQVYYNLALESGDEFKGSALYAYSLLKKGDFEDALTAASGDEQIQKRISMFVAASSGATREQIDQALYTEYEFQSDESLTWAVWGLSLREGGDGAELEEVLRAFNNNYTEQIFRFMAALKSNKENLNDSEKRLNGLEPLARAYAYSAACVYLQNKCPGDWMKQANSLLFVHERPYLAQ